MASNNYFFKKNYTVVIDTWSHFIWYILCVLVKLSKIGLTNLELWKILYLIVFLSMHAVRMHVWFFVVILNIFEMTWEESLVARVCYCWHDTITLLSDIVSIPFLCHTLYYHKIQDVNKHVIVINNVIRRKWNNAVLLLYFCLCLEHVHMVVLFTQISL